MPALPELQARPAYRIALAMIAAAGLLAACGSGPASQDAEPDLVGAWRARVQFDSGAFASLGNLEFMYVFNVGGTMTESSNYDGAPPVPPAYGAWRRTAPRHFEARYEFFTTAPPARIDELAKGGGWLPAGRGVLVEQLTLAEDGQSFTSTIRYEAYDRAGQVTVGGGTARGEGRRIRL